MRDKQGKKNNKKKQGKFWKNMEKGHLLQIHLLEKSAQHQNLNCSTPFEQMTKIYETARKSKKYAVRVPRVNFEQMQVLDQNEQLFELLLLSKD